MNLPQLANRIWKFEDGDMCIKEQVKLFSDLIKSGLAWSLSGFYGRTAKAMIEQELLDKDGNINQERLDDITMQGE